MELFLFIIGLIIFFLPGLLLSYLAFPVVDLIKRSVFSLLFSISLLTITGVLLYFLNALTQVNAFLSFFFLSFLFFLIILSKKKSIKTIFKKDILYLFLFSLFSTIYKYIFSMLIKNPANAYAYSFKFIGEKVPNLGFYTGMAKDKSDYIGNLAGKTMKEFLFLDNFSFIEIFLITFLFLGLIYLVFLRYRSRKLALTILPLMALFPIELFYSTNQITGHSLSYLSLFPLFLLFKSEDKRIFWPALLFTIAVSFTYYTASIVILLASLGFIIALFVKTLIRKKSLKAFLTNRKTHLFLIIIIFLCLNFIFFSSRMTLFGWGVAKDTSYIKESAKEIKLFALGGETINFENIKYRDPDFLGLSAIRWQIVFFLLCGSTFLIYVFRKRKLKKENLDLLLCTLPVLIVSYGFLHVNLPTRIFDYFAFFGLLAIKIPKKYFKYFTVLSFVFLFATGIYTAKAKKLFLETSDSELQGSKEIAQSFEGKIFSDQEFVNLLILNNHYNVTGDKDDSLVVKNLFYNKNKSLFLKTIDAIAKQGIDYIAITERIRKQYILMLNYPIKPITNKELYQELKKVYDNEDVKLYKINNNFDYSN